MPGGIQLESGGAFLLHGIVVALGQRGKDRAGVPGGDRVHQGVVTGPADLKHSVREALGLVRGADLDNLNTALSGIPIAIGNPPLLLSS